MVKDHKGKEYKNYMQMAKAWGISYEVFHQRFSVLKWPVYEALETCEEDGTMIKDTDGVVYDTFADMCAAWEVSMATYRARRLRGWTRDDALTTPPIKPGTQRYEQDQVADLFERLGTMTAQDLLEAVQLYISMKEQHRDMHSAEYEGRPRKKTGPAPKELVDRDGNKFSGLRDACAAYGQNFELAKHRIFDGWPLQYALDFPSGKGKFEDHLGNKFSSYSAMCKYYEIDKHEFAKRYDAGWTLRDALMLS